METCETAHLNGQAHRRSSQPPHVGAGGRSARRNLPASSAIRRACGFWTPWRPASCASATSPSWSGSANRPFRTSCGCCAACASCGRAAPAGWSTTRSTTSTFSSSSSRRSATSEEPRMTGPATHALSAPSASCTRSPPSRSKGWTATRKSRSSNGASRSCTGLEALDADVLGQRLEDQVRRREAEYVRHRGSRRADRHARMARARTAGAPHPRRRRRGGCSSPSPARRSWPASCWISHTCGNAGRIAAFVIAHRRRAASTRSRRAVARRARARARHQRADARRRRGRDCARAVVGRRVGHFSLRAGATARGARHGARTHLDPRADGSGAARGARPPRQPRAARGASTTSRSGNT